MEMNCNILCVIVGLALLSACHGGEAEVDDPVGLPFITERSFPSPRTRAVRPT